MNAARELIERGLERRREQGAREVLVRLLSSKLGAPPEAILRRVSAADTARIDRWAERALTAPSAEAVVGDG